MAGINVNGIGRNPYADSYLTSAKNRSNTTSKDTFVNAVKKVEESKNSADTSNVMYPGDVTIDYPPRINNAVNNSVVSEKSKDEMSLDEYKQWVMNQISQFPVSGWVRSTFSSGSIVIKEEAFERMKNDPEYENYVLNRVRSAYSVQGLVDSAVESSGKVPKEFKQQMNNWIHDLVSTISTRGWNNVPDMTLSILYGKSSLKDMNQLITYQYEADRMNRQWYSVL